MKLYLIRHGESLSSEMDPQQPLSEQGIKETAAVADFLQHTPLEIDEIMHSTKIRAKQTAEILGNALASDIALIQREGLKPMDPIEPILEEIRTMDRNVMIVGHLPFMEKLLIGLLGGDLKASPINLCGSCVVCLEGARKSWQIAWVISPKLCCPDLC